MKSMEIQPNRIKTPLSEQINELIELQDKDKLTKKMAQDWINSFPEDERIMVKDELEFGLSSHIEDLPE